MCPLATASANGDTDLVQLLLELNANPNGSYGQSPLTAAVKKAHKGIVRLLIAHRAEVTKESLLSACQDDDHNEAKAVIMDILQEERRRIELAEEQRFAVETAAREVTQSAIQNALRLECERWPSKIPKPSKKA